MKRRAVWGCDDVNEGTLHNGVGDARVNGIAGEVQTDEQTADCISSLEHLQQEAAAAAADDSNAASAAALPDGLQRQSALFRH